MLYPDENRDPEVKLNRDSAKNTVSGSVDNFSPRLASGETGVKGTEKIQLFV
jgi:hypothetical protein